MLAHAALNPRGQEGERDPSAPNLAFGMSPVAGYVPPNKSLPGCGAKRRSGVGRERKSLCNIAAEAYSRASVAPRRSCSSRREDHCRPSPTAPHRRVDRQHPARGSWSKATPAGDPVQKNEALLVRFVEV